MSPDENCREINDDGYKILLTNARSLSPKICSFHDVFREHDIDVAMVTESWLNDGCTLDRDVIDLEYGTNLKIIYKNRPKTARGARRVGGGVSIIYDKNSCSLRERKVVGNKFELVMAQGRVGKVGRSAVFMCLYIVPSMKAAQLDELNTLINLEILQLKSKGDPLIFVGGDLNNRNLTALDDFTDIKRVNFDPTRGPACLDILYSNAHTVTSAVWPPLHSDAGVPSDHDCVVFSGSEPKQKNFIWTTRTTRKHSWRAVEEFGRIMAATDWDELLPPHLGPNALVSIFQTHTGQLVDRLFPLQRVRVRSNEPPWITHGIRRLARHKKRIFKRCGKSRAWFKLRDKIRELIAASQQQYVERVTQSGTSTKTYFSAVKALGSAAAAPQQWTLMDLFPGKTPLEAGNETASFFTKISDAFDPLPPGGAMASGGYRRKVTVQEVAKKLKEAKKPNSSVEGDVLPRLMKAFHGHFAAPATKIFNAIFDSNVWPTNWKTETTVVIPKVNNPESLADCRNISCTAFLSKVLESIVLEDLRNELQPDPEQYGGLKGSSVDHLLVDLYDRVLTSLDDGSPAVVVGVDFEKAFNRLDHRECLRQLRRLGASEASISLVRAFLSGRSMRVKVGDVLSTARLLRGGSPQGSILGCLLYCLTTQQIGIDTDAGPQEPPGNPLPHSPVPTLDPDPQEPGFGVMNWLNDLSLSSTSLDSAGSSTALGDLSDGDSTYPFDSRAWTFKYVDDTTIIESVPRGNEVRHITGTNPTEWIPAPIMEKALIHITTRAAEIGMKVNCRKTQMICMAPDNGYSSFSSITVGNETMVSGQGIKLLGFQLAASMAPQVKFIKEKFRKRFWSLIHLRQAGMAGDQLFKIYATLVRPVIETNCVVYHPMLNKGQTADIERLQKLVTRLCYGREEYKSLLESKNIKSLEERREMAVRKFTSKAIMNEKFSDRWFKRRAPIETELRVRRPYIERKCRTERLMKSPLVYIQKTANDLVTA